MARLCPVVRRLTVARTVGRPDIAHQKDEYIIIEDMLKATAIYAQAIYELAGEETFCYRR